jgi:hypothetical protein
MEFLSEDPTYLAGGLGLLAGSFLIALRLTQQGKYLVWGISSLALMALVLVIEQLWVTDNERIEQVVYELGRAVASSDIPRVLDELAPDVQYVQGGNVLMSGSVLRSYVESTVGAAKFDILRISHLRANAGGQSRRGTAEFRVIASGTFQRSFQMNFGTTNSTWSLGLRETSPGVWKINRITPVSIPGGQSVIPTAGTFRRGQGGRGAAAAAGFPGFTRPDRLRQGMFGPVAGPAGPSVPSPPTILAP